MPSDEICASSGNGQWKNGNYWPFVVEPTSAEIRKIVEEINDERVITETDERKAMYAFNFLAKHYSKEKPVVLEKDKWTFLPYYRMIEKNETKRTYIYIKQCAKNTGLGELLEGVEK
jgi:hypothetical protein